MENSRFASFGRRFIAFLLDVVFVLLINYVLFSLVLGPFGGLLGAMGLKDFQFGEDIVKGAFASIGAFLVLAITILGVFFVAFIYDFVLLATPKQATIGKMLMKIKVIKVDGTSINIFEAFFRSLIKFASGFFFIFLWILCLFTTRKQNLHDLIVNAIVVDSN